MCYSRFLLVLVAAMAYAQQAAPKIDPVWHHEWTNEDMFTNASVIVIAEVKALQYVGLPVRATNDEGYRGEWQLLKTTMRIENVLRGAIGAVESDFYYYASIGPATGSWQSLHIGDRYLFFLTFEQGALRAVRDFRRSSIEVGSGRHNNLILNGKASRELIGLLLLSPGEDLDALAFVRSMPNAVLLAGEWLGKCRTLDLLADLEKSRDATIREAAHNQMDISPWNAGDCKE